ETRRTQRKKGVEGGKKQDLGGVLASFCFTPAVSVFSVSLWLLLFQFLQADDPRSHIIFSATLEQSIDVVRQIGRIIPVQRQQIEHSLIGHVRLVVRLVELYQTNQLLRGKRRASA